MNIKESIISSSFFHLVLFLLMVAIASYTTGFSRDFQKIISVDLTMEDKIYSADRPPLASSLLPSAEVKLSDQEANNLSEPEKKVEPIIDPAKIENAGKPPAQTKGFASQEAYYQFIMMHKKIFEQKSMARVNELLGEAFKVNKRNFYGGNAIVSLKFGPDGILSKVLVDSASPDLKAFLEEISWAAIPAPADYSLRSTGVQIEFTVLEGYMNFKINTL